MLVGLRKLWSRKMVPFIIHKLKNNQKVLEQLKRHKNIDGQHRGRPYETIRNEVLTSAINFLEQRLDSDQEGIMKNINDICSSDSPSSFLHAARPLLNVQE